MDACITRNNLPKDFRAARLVVFFILLVLPLASCNDSSQTLKGEKNLEVITTNTGLQYQDLVIGDGKVAKTGDLVVVHYTGWLTDGTKFDSSIDRNKPFEFTLGAGKVIRGWDEGVAGMKVGGKRKLTLPPTLGYGSRGIVNVIPANATLIFDVELLKIK